MAALPTQFCWAGNRGALTTTFTPPSTCLETTSLYLDGISVPPAEQNTVYYIGLWTQAWAGDLPNFVSDSCMPPAATPIPLNQAWYYSPGICPSAYTPAAPLLTLPNICNSVAALPETVTGWVCCPSSYGLATAMTDKDWGLSTVCVSTAPGPATLTNVWPVSWVSANLDFDTYSFWPPTLPSGIILPTTVITKPTVIAEAIPIMWESTDTLVQSWFDRVQGSVPTHLTTSPPPTQSATTPTSTNTKTSGALNRGRGNNLSVAALGALSLITLLILSS